MSIEYIKLYKFIENNEETMTYINKLMKTIEVKDQIDNKECLDKLQELGASYVEKTKHLEKLMKEIRNKDLYFCDKPVFYLEGYLAKYEEDSNTAHKKYGHYSFNHNDEYCCYHDAEWLNEDRVSYPIAINGHELTKEVLEKEERDHTSKKEYKEWLKDNSNLNLELKELEEEITKDLELLNKKLFGKKQIKERLSSNKEKLLKLKNKQLRGNYLKERADFFESLDTEKKNLIIDYLDSIEECNEISKEIRDNIFSINLSCRDKMINNLDELIAEAISNGLVTPEEVEKYNYILMNIDLSNVILDKYEQRSYESGEHYWGGNYQIKKLIDAYCHKIMNLKMSRDFTKLSKEATNKIKVKKITE